MISGLGWGSIARLGLVQSALGSIVMLVTSLLNRIMVVEYALPALIPAALVAWHYGVQLSRPRWGHKSDQGDRRTPWIIGGMAVLATGGLLATISVTLVTSNFLVAILLLVLAFSMIGIGVGACGTSLLALLASSVVAERRPAAAAMTWIMMIAGIVATAAIAGSQLTPFSPERLVAVAGGVVVIAFIVTVAAVFGIESRAPRVDPQDQRDMMSFGSAMHGIWSDEAARKLTIFIFVSMLAYSAQDLILEPFSGLIFGYSPAQSTQLSSLQNLGVLLGMLIVGIGGNAFGPSSGIKMRPWIIGGCCGSAIALGCLGFTAINAEPSMLRPTVFVLGLANGIFAVAAIATMMELAGANGVHQAGARMGVWGAAQAIAFGMGGFLGAAGLDVGRALIGNAGIAFGVVFAAEAALFVIAAILARGLGVTGATIMGRMDMRIRT